MLCLWILAAVAALLILLCITRLGVLATLGEEFTLDVKFGLLHFRVVPARKTKQEKKRAGRRTEKKEVGKAKKKREEKFTKPNLEDVRAAWGRLWPPLRRTLRRLGKGIRIDPLKLSFIFGGRSDPAAAAEHYGKAQAAVWTIMPAMEQLMNIPSPGIHIGLDFEAEQTNVQGRIGITVRVGTLLACGFGMGVPAVKWLMQYKKEHRNTVKLEQEKQPPDIAA